MNNLAPARLNSPIQMPLRCRIVLAMIVLALSVLVSATNGYAANDAFITYVVHGESGGITENVPVTFGAIFAKGDVPPGSSVAARDGKGNPLPLQVDVKAKHPDGSLRHAVLTVTIPHLSDGNDVSVSLSRGPKEATAPLPSTALPRDFDTVLTLKMKDGRMLHASARDLLKTAKPDLWLSGSQVTEWWMTGPLRDAQGKADPHLSVRFGIRSYGAGRPLRVEVDVENTWVWVPGPRTEFYDAKITAHGNTVFEQAGMAHATYTRWREVFWWDKPVSAYVEQNLAYLKKARIVANYVADRTDAKAELDRTYPHFQSSDRGPLQAGIITAYMPTTGGRGDIGMLPSWTVDYLLTMDQRGYEMTLKSGDLAGGFWSHLRNTKTNRPATAEEFPNLSTHSNFVGRPGNLEISDTGGVKPTLVGQSAHEPSLAFIPYVITGDRYYLEELEFWSQWNAWGTAPGYHGFQQALVSWDELRGQAWSLRTLAQAAYIAPDSDPLKATLLRELKANIDYYDKTFVNNPQADLQHTISVAHPGVKPAPTDYPPWMDDYLTSVLGYIVDLGFENARPFAAWKAYFPVQRMINKDYCWMLATPYHISGVNPYSRPSWAAIYRATFESAQRSKQKVDVSDVTCGSDQMAFALGLKPGEMLSGAAGGYQANLQPALAAAVNLGVPGAEEAWEKFKTVTKSNKYFPQWTIVPWTKN